MNVQNLLSYDPPLRRRSDLMNGDGQQEGPRPHQYPTRHSTASANSFSETPRYGTPQGSPTYAMPPQTNLDGFSLSPTKTDPKNITFELLFNGDSHYRARLPMKVQIFPHDNTEGIVSTVKNFFGLYHSTIAGVSFEDGAGHTLIASYDNFANAMTVYVRVIADMSQSFSANDPSAPQPLAHAKPERTPHLDEGFQMPPPASVIALNHAHQLSRPGSRLASRQSTSPQLAGAQRSASVQKARSRPSLKRESRENSFQARLDELNSDNHKSFGSSDGDAASVTSSFRARNEHLTSAEISEVNILEGGRRQKAKFESSELPLYVPPQIPAPQSTSSVSPQRRSNGNDNTSPFARPLQRVASWTQPLQSPQYPPQGMYPIGNGTPGAPAPPHGHRLRDRVHAPSMLPYVRNGVTPRAQGFGILPTPDPTIASTISDEDVALQLMRLGDPSNLSHGRTSASTMDDALSGRADIASSATSDGEEYTDDERQQHGMIEKSINGNAKLNATTTLPHASGEEHDGYFDPDGQARKRQKLSSSKSSMNKVRTHGASTKSAKTSKPRNPGHSKKQKPSLASNGAKVPISPASLPPQSRKTSSASLMGPPQLPFNDEDDLSSKPRCQRCRKSKKGCDRQRPCQRCKDAGIGIEGCVSEDEGNGRKGRFGRHMGVLVPKEKDMATASASFETEQARATLDDMPGGDKSKKRKR